MVLGSKETPGKCILYAYVVPIEMHEVLLARLEVSPSQSRAVITYGVNLEGFRKAYRHCRRSGWEDCGWEEPPP
jgi:hypothetical protein